MELDYLPVSQFIAEMWNVKLTRSRRTQVDHTIRCMFPVWWHWDGKYTTKGLVKLALGRIIKLWVAVASLYALVFAIRNGKEKSKEALRELLAKARQTATGGVQRLVDVL